MIDPLTVTIIFFIFTGTVMTAGLVLNSTGVGKQWYDNYKANKWNRKYSMTKHNPRDIRDFATWFQNHQTRAAHIVTAVGGILTQPCVIPALDIPFKFQKVVIALSQSNAGAFSVTVSSNKRQRIGSFWRQISTYEMDDY